MNKDPLFAATSIPETSTETRFTFTAEVDKEFMDLLKEAKDIVGFVPSVQVLKRTPKEFVSKRKTVPRRSASAAEVIHFNTIHNKKMLISIVECMQFN